MMVMPAALVSRQEAAALPPPKISPAALAATVWSLQAVATALVIFRLVVRFRFSRRLYPDDYFVLLALAILLGNAIVQTIMAPPMFDMLNVAAGLQAPDATFMDRTTMYLKCQFASTVLFWSCLWAVKASFLAFFYRLVSNLKWPRRAWYLICIVTGLSYIGSVITYPLSCTSFTLGECSEPKNIQGSLISLRFSTIVDIITDVAIMCLPIYLTLGLKMSLRQKIGLIAVLSLGGIVTIFSIIRIIVTYTVTTQPEVTWLALWSSIESGIAVVVACLPIFKVLFSQGTGSSARSKYVDISGVPGNSRSVYNGTNNVNSSISAPKGDEMELPERARDIRVTKTVVISGADKLRDSDGDSQEQILHEIAGRR